MTRPAVGRQAVGTRAAAGAGGFSLGGALGALSDGELAALLRARPDLAYPAPPDLATLARRVEAWPSIQECTAALDLGCHQVLETLCLLPQPSTVPKVAALLGVGVDAGGQEALEGVIARLVERALVFRRGEEIRLLPALAAVSHPAALGPPVASAFARASAHDVAQIAQRLGARPSRATKAAALEAIAAVHAEPGAVARIAEEGPNGTEVLVSRLASQWPVVEHPGVYPPSDRTSVGWLVRRGVLAPLTWRSAVLTREAGLALRGGKPFANVVLTRPALPTTEVDTAEVDRAAAERALRLVADVETILDAWGDEPAKVLKVGGLGVREVRRVARLVERSDTEAARLIDLAAAAGLARVIVDTGAEAGAGAGAPAGKAPGRAPGGARGGRGLVALSVAEVAVPTVAYDEWLALEAPARWARLVAGWLAASHHVGMAGTLDGAAKPVPPLLARSPEANAPERRRLVLRVLADAGAGRALAAETVAAQARWDAPAVWQRGPAPAAVLVSWILAEAELLGVWASGALSAPGRLVARNQVDKAAAVLAQVTPVTTAHFILQGDLTVVCPGELAPEVRRELELVSDVESRGAASVHRFTEPSLRRGFDAGRGAEEILAFLERHASHGVPQALSYLVSDVARRYGSVRVGTARCYVRSDDAALLAEVVRARRLGRLGLRLLAPTVAVATSEAGEVHAAIQAAGYMAAAEDADGALVVARPRTRRAPPAPAARTAGGTFLDVEQLEVLARQLADPELLEEWGEALLLEVEAEQAEGPAPPEVDVDAVVAGLRSVGAGAGGPAPAGDGPVVSEGGPVVPGPALAEDEDLFGDEVAAPRPGDIASGYASAKILLELADEEDWGVRVAYATGNGVTAQVSGFVWEIEDGSAVLECPPDSSLYTVPLERVRWARVLTEVEEAMLG